MRFKSFRSVALTLIVLVFAGLVVAIPQANADQVRDASVEVRAKKPFAPRLAGSKKVAILKVQQSRRMRQTWCLKTNGNRPWVAGLRVAKAGQHFIRFNSYSRLAKNYRKAQRTARNVKERNKMKAIQRKYARAAKKGSKQRSECERLRTGGSGGGSGGGTPLRFNIADAVGVSQGSASSARRGPMPRQSSTGIQAVLADGSLRDAITSGTAQVSKVAVSPSGLLVVAFTQKVNLANATQQWSNDGCLIATVDRASGIPTCIDSTLSWLSGAEGDTIQFDSSGGIYYLGSADCNPQCVGVLRRYQGGATTDLVNGGISVNEFLVAPNGTVFISGSTTATNTWFNRRLSPSGGILNLGSPASTGQASYKVFADGNVYMNGSDGGWSGLARFITSTDSIDPQLWIGQFGAPSANDWSAYCAGAGSAAGPCQGARGLDTSNRLTAQTASGKNFIRGTEGVVQVFPTLAAYTTPIQEITVMTAAGNSLLLAGTSTAGENLLVRFDTDTNTATTLSSRASSHGEIEFYHLLPSSQGYTLFDGLRFRDNTYVIGRINTTTGEVTILSTVTGKLDDFRVF